MASAAFPGRTGTAVSPRTAAYEFDEIGHWQDFVSYPSRGGASHHAAQRINEKAVAAVVLDEFSSKSCGKLRLLSHYEQRKCRTDRATISRS